MQNVSGTNDASSVPTRNEFQPNEFSKTEFFARMLSQKGLDQFYSTNFSALGRFYGRTLRIDDLPAGTPRPVSRTAVGLFEKFLLRGVPGNNAQWGNPFTGILGRWGHFC